MDSKIQQILLKKQLLWITLLLLSWQNLINHRFIEFKKIIIYNNIVKLKLFAKVFLNFYLIMQSITFETKIIILMILGNGNTTSTFTATTAVTSVATTTTP